MARTITEIHEAILMDIANNSTLNVVATSTSRYSRFRQFAYVVAVAIWSLEKIFDLFKTETEATLVAMKPHNIKWYRDKAEAFQYGSSLPWGDDEYDNSALTEDQVDAQKIVAHAAVIEQNGTLLIKVAKLSSGDLAALAVAEKAAFDAYIEKVKDAGVVITKESGAADYLKLELIVYYDALVLNSSGERLDGTDDTPVQDAIDTYLQNLPFNGELIKASLVDALQAVDGVTVPVISNAWYKYGALSYQLIDIRYTPDAGYLRIYDRATDLSITWVAES